MLVGAAEVAGGPGPGEHPRRPGKEAAENGLQAEGGVIQLVAEGTGPGAPGPGVHL